MEDDTFGLKPRNPFGLELASAKKQSKEAKKAIRFGGLCFLSQCTNFLHCISTDSPQHFHSLSTYQARGAHDILGHQVERGAEQHSEDEEFGKSCQISVVTSAKGISASKSEIVHTADLLEEQRASKTQRSKSAGINHIAN